MIDYVMMFMCFLAMLDVLLTHYRLYLDKLKHIFNMNREVNWIPRLIMAGNPRPRSFLIGSMINIVCFIGIVYLAKDLYAAYFITGTLFMLAYMHYNEIIVYKANWDNEVMWMLLSKLQNVQDLPWAPKDKRLTKKGGDE